MHKNIHVTFLGISLKKIDFMVRRYCELVVINFKIKSKAACVYVTKVKVDTHKCANLLGLGKVI